MRTIIVRKCGDYKDGGTREYRDDQNRRYFIDGRIRSTTKGKIFDRYPGDAGARILDDVVLTTEI